MNRQFRLLILEKFESQAEAAKTMGTSETHLTRLIRGYVEPRTGELEQLAQFLGDRVYIAFLPSLRGKIRESQDRIRR